MATAPDSATTSALSRAALAGGPPNVICCKVRAARPPPDVEVVQLTQRLPRRVTHEAAAAFHVTVRYPSITLTAMTHPLRPALKDLVGRGYLDVGIVHCYTPANIAPVRL